MMKMMLDCQMEDTRHLLQKNRDEPIVPIIKPEMNIEQSEEGNYSRTVSQVKPRVVRRNDTEKEIERDGRMYKNFLGAKPPIQ